MEDAGVGVPIVLLHGWFLNARMWQPQFDVLADRLRLIAIDLRGHGGTPCPVTPRSLDRPRDVMAVLDQLGVERAVFCGLSMGGPIALQIALDHPERCLGLALLAAGPGPADRPMKATAEMRADAELQAQRLLELGVVDYFYSAGVSSALGVKEFLANPAHRRFFDSVLAANRAAWLADTFRLRALDVPPEMGRLLTAERRRRLPELMAPVLFMVGARDAEFLPVAELLKTDVPHSDIEVVAGATHLISIDSAERVNQRLFEFVRTCAAGKT